MSLRKLQNTWRLFSSCEFVFQMFCYGLLDYQMNSVWFDEAELNSRKGTLLCEIVPLLVAKERTELESEHSNSALKITTT